MKDKDGFTIRCKHSDWQIVDERDNKEFVCLKFPTFNFSARRCYADETCKYYEPDLRISVLMPCYNAGEYLYRSIGSIQKSTVQDFEIICLDDGSTDNTLEILHELMEKDNRIRVYSREEKGYAVTMNELLDKAQGKYVINIDPDDWIEPSMFRTMLGYMDKDTDFVKCGFWFELGDKRQKYQYTTEAAEFCPRKLNAKSKMEYFVSQVALWTCLIRREFIERHHIRLYETPGAAYQDTSFNFLINTLADKIRLIPDALYHYNKTNVNASTASPRYPLAPVEQYRWILQWCMENAEYGIWVRSVLCRCRFGSYLWNMARIRKEDRLEFAKMAQEDFIEDNDFIDVRMFSEEEYQAFIRARNNPVDFVKMIENVEKGA